MPSLLETVTSLLRQGDNLSKLGELLGTDVDQASALVDLATPVVITGLADRAFAPGGTDIVVRLLDGVDPTIVDNPLVFVERGDATIGEGLLLSIFTNEHASLTTALAEQGNVSEPVITRLLAGILALAIGVLGRRRAVSGVDEAGVLTLLSAEKSGLPTGPSPATAGVDDGSNRNRMPAMAGAAVLVDGVAGSSGSIETDRATAGPTDHGTGTTDGTTSTASPSLETEGALPASGDGNEPTNRSTNDDRSPVASTDRDGRGPLVLIVGGLTAVVLLAWALSQFGGGGPETAEAGSGEGTVDQPVGDTDTDTTVFSGGETPPAADQPGVDDDGGDTDAGDTDAEPPPDDDTAESNDVATDPVTINEELSLDPITFEVRSATITPDGLAVLDVAAEFLKADPELTIEIAGHTDSDGDAADNMRLSQDRADEVKAYLESLGIDGARMTPIGYGEDDPVASNDTEAGKAQNRRIEFVIQ